MHLTIISNQLSLQREFHNSIILQRRHGRDMFVFKTGNHIAVMSANIMNVIQAICSV